MIVLSSKPLAARLGKAFREIQREDAAAREFRKELRRMDIAEAVRR